jgi:hypothetical protein
VNWISLLGLDALMARLRAAVIEAAIAAEDRADLAKLEWQQYQSRLILTAGLVVALGGLTVIAAVMLSIALLVTFWDSEHRLLVAWLIGGGWLILWALVFFALRSVGRQLANPLNLTRSELLADWRALKQRL